MWGGVKDAGADVSETCLVYVTRRTEEGLGKRVTFHHAAVVAPQKIISSAQSCVSRICLTSFMLTPQVRHCVHFRVEETHLKRVARQGGSEWRLRPRVLWADITPRATLRPTESETRPGSAGWEHKQGSWRRAWCPPPPRHEPLSDMVCPLLQQSVTQPLHDWGPGVASSRSGSD